MACNCLDILRSNEVDSTKDLPEKTLYVWFDLANIETWSEGRKRLLCKNQTGQRITIGVEYINKKGVPVKKERKSFYTHIFCPFCGTKYIKP